MTYVTLNSIFWILFQGPAVCLSLIFIFNLVLLGQKPVPSCYIAPVTFLSPTLFLEKSPRSVFPSFQPIDPPHPSFVQYLGASISASLMILQKRDTDRETETIQFTCWFARDIYVVQICFICVWLFLN